MAVFDLESRNAKTIGGYWVEKGKKQEKEYKQDGQLFYMVTFQKSDGDSFLVVLSKEKPEKK